MRMNSDGPGQASGFRDGQGQGAGMQTGGQVVGEADPERKSQEAGG